MKTCSKCRESKPVSAFSKNKSSKHRLQNNCRTCAKACTAAWTEANKDRAAAKAAAWKAANRDRVAANNAAWKIANPEKVSIKKAKWASANPEKRAASKHRRRALTASNGVNAVTTAETAEIIAMPCTACGVAGPSQVDHIIPIARGGAHSIGNLMPLCRSCNASKCDMLYIEWKHSKRPQARKVFAA